MSTDFPVFTETFHSSVYPAIDPTRDALSARGKVVLVTGGSRGIGKSIARSFAVAGARAIIILGRTETSLETTRKDISALAKASGDRTVVRSFAVDICHTDAVSRVFETVREELGPVDVLVNNAGDMHLDTIERCSVDEWWSSFEVNVKGTLNCMQALLHSGLTKDASSPPTIINVSTIGISMAAVPTMSAYAASKLAAWKTAECLGVELGDKVRVFSIHPGRISTDMAKRAGIPTFDDEELPGAFCVWLAATTAADFLRGRLVACNWDVDELVQRRNEIVEENMLTVALVGLGELQLRR